MRAEIGKEMLIVKAKTRGGKKKKKKKKKKKDRPKPRTLFI